MTTYAVTGATGSLGRLAVEALLASDGVTPSEVIAVVRDAAKAQPLADSGVTVRVADYDDPATLTTALTGVDRLLLVSGSEIGKRVAQHTNVIEAAVAAGVGILAYTSILNAETSTLQIAAEHQATEKLLASSGLTVILLRNGWYSENYTGGLAHTVAGGVFYGTGAGGRVAPAARADYARAAVAALIDGTPRAYELAGPQHLTYPDIAAVVAEVSGSPVRYQDVSEADYAANLVAVGVPQPVAEVLADADHGVSRGELDSTSTDLTDLIGNDLVPFAEVVRTALG
ncbi:SDR family oxidoreductase [Williamsia sp. CHRR-6]|uniref:SDR family oxidoreductase n=1 Tax=Williamsia sp. CHRR-6 TaxID=2835871 RepID=UPI001BD9ABA2|nr:SDR family oxidoreductase [Williamsia sp. CHRR-6]MBT0568527.1 SDR family oxidoreductase [Williamsia sp. CHRR-6]